MLGSDMSVQKSEEVGEKGFDGERAWVGHLCGEMPLRWRQVHDD